MISPSLWLWISCTQAFVQSGREYVNTEKKRRPGPHFKAWIETFRTHSGINKTPLEVKLSDRL